MNSINKFYSTYTGESANEYDILELPDEMERGFAFGIYYSGMPNYGGETVVSKTTENDYDMAFRDKATKMEPVYKVEDLLTYHFDRFQERRGDVSLFLKHMRYVIAPLLDGFYKAQVLELILKWLDKKDTMITKKHFDEKVEFLKKLYADLSRGTPSHIFSSHVDPREYGESIGFDRGTTDRIINDLIADRLVTVTAGFRKLLLKPEARMFLEEIEMNQQRAQTGISVTVGNNSSVQFQQGNVNSNQRIYIEQQSNSDLKELVVEVRQGMDSFAEHLNNKKIEELKDEVDYLEKQLNKDEPNETMINTLVGSVWGILKAVPANVVASVISGGLIPPGI